MSKFKFSYVFWAVLAAAALFVAACDNGSDNEGSSGPGLLPAKEVGVSSLFIKDANSGNGTKGNPIVFDVSTLAAKNASAQELSLKDLVDVGTGAADYEFVDVNSVNNAIGISASDDISSGKLLRPQAPGTVTVRVSNGANGKQVYLRVIFTKDLPKVKVGKIGDVSAESVEGSYNKSIVTVKPDKEVALNDLLPKVVTDLPSATITWSIVNNAENSTAKDSTFSINQLKDTGTAKGADAELPTDASLIGIRPTSAVSKKYQPVSGSPLAVHYGTVKLKASVVESDLVDDSYEFTVVFAGEDGTLAQATSATSGAGLVFDTTAAKDGSTKAKAIIVNTKDAGASSPAHALFLNTKVTVADLTSGAVGTLTYKKASGEEDFTAVTIPTTGADSGKIAGLAAKGELLLQVTDSGNAKTLPNTLYFKIPFRKDASALTISGDSRLAALEANAKDFAGVIDFPAFAVKTAAPANVDQTTGFDFAYTLTNVSDSSSVTVTLGTTADPGQLPALTPTKTYKLTVTATPKSTNTEYAGAKSQDFFFKYVATTFRTALATADGLDGNTTGIVASGATANQVVGLAIDADAAKQAAGNALEVWLKASDYFDANGVVKPKTPSGSDNYVVAWDAYDPKGATKPTETSVKAADPTNVGAKEIGISKSQTDAPTTSAAPTKLGRMTINVGTGLLGQNEGGVVVVSIYDPVAGTGDHSLSDKVGRLARYELTITKAEAPDLTGAKVTAKAAHADTATNLNTALGTATLINPAVAVGGTATAATVTLATANASTADHGVAFNTFKVDTTAGTVKLEEPSWTVKGADHVAAVTGASPVPGISETSVKDKDGAALTNPTTDETALADAVRADFTSAAGENGQVTLTATDKYGQTATITVTLDDLL